MTTRFTLLPNVDKFTDVVSVGDIVGYEIECSSWGTVASATSVVESGTAAVSSASVTSNVVSFTGTFVEAGKVLVSLLISSSGGLAKKIWLEVLVKDLESFADDYED